MKKYLFVLSITLCASLSILLFSCSVIKRHYAEGYYVSHNSSKTDSKAQDQNLQNKKTELSSYTIQNIHESSKADNISEPNALIIKEDVITASNKNIKSKSIPVMPSKKLMAYSTTLIGYTKENLKSFNKKTNDESLVVDALSLFWIIILILLILWLVAILTGGWGLGWGVHIILLVALILLILWLLRII
jgi:hypothetical protein